MQTAGMLVIFSSGDQRRDAGAVAAANAVATCSGGDHRCGGCWMPVRSSSTRLVWLRSAALNAANIHLLDGLNIGLPTLAAALLLLTPLTLTIATLSLALAGVAKSFKEAQNYLTPLFLVVSVPAMAVLMPTISPSPLLDMVPIVGPLVVLKDALQNNGPDWVHVVASSLTGVVIAWVVINWATRLLNDENFLYPGMKKDGWGRWRRFSKGPTVPSAVEALLIFAISAAAFLGMSVIASPDIEGHYGQILVGIMAPLVVGIALPSVLLIIAGNYSWREAAFLRGTSLRNWLLILLLVPVALAISNALGIIQMYVLPAEQPDDIKALETIIHGVITDAGLPLALLAIAVTPGICEELLCRGPMLSGLRRSLGTPSAVMITAFLFAALHMSPYRFLPQMVLGIVLAVVVIRVAPFSRRC